MLRPCSAWVCRSRRPAPENSKQPHHGDVWRGASCYLDMLVLRSPKWTAQHSLCREQAQGAAPSRQLTGELPPPQQPWQLTLQQILGSFAQRRPALRRSAAGRPRTRWTSRSHDCLPSQQDGWGSRQFEDWNERC